MGKIQIPLRSLYHRAAFLEGAMMVYLREINGLIARLEGTRNMKEAALEEYASVISQIKVAEGGEGNNVVSDGAEKSV